MVSMEEAVIARLERFGEHFEVLVDHALLEKYYSDGLEDFVDLFAIDTVFKDAKKGDKASEESMRKAFESADFAFVARFILDHGHVQLTTEKRRDLVEKKTKMVVSEIARNAVNPQTGTPHPPARIEAAMKEAGVHIDPFKPMEKQVAAVLDAIRPIIPIRFDKVKVAVKVAGVDYGRLYGDIAAMGSILKEEWLPNGCWVGLVEIPAGMQNDFYDMLNRKTKGAVETEIVK